MRPSAVRIGGDGQPVELEPAFGPQQLLDWMGYARAGMAAGAPGIAIGACPHCRAPLAISSKQEIALPCPHCAETTRGPASDVVVDQWTEPWAQARGPDLDVEYRLVTLEDARGVAAGCAACGAPTPCSDPSTRCATCGAVTWVSRGEGRVQLGVRIDGTRAGRPFKAVVPIVTGEGMLRADAAHGSEARSGNSLLGVTGIGCAAAVGGALVLSILAALAAHFVHC